MKNDNNIEERKNKKKKHNRSRKENEEKVQKTTFTCAGPSGNPGRCTHKPVGRRSHLKARRKTKEVCK